MGQGRGVKGSRVYVREGGQLSGRVGAPSPVGGARNLPAPGFGRDPNVLPSLAFSDTHTRIHSCNDGSVAGKWECNGTFVDPATNTTLDRDWENMWPNFDNGKAGRAAVMPPVLTRQGRVVLPTAQPQLGAVVTLACQGSC